MRNKKFTHYEYKPVLGDHPPVWLVRIVRFQFWLSETELELGLILDHILGLEPESVGGQNIKKGLLKFSNFTYGL
jgi:hypothetical protein